MTRRHFWLATIARAGLLGTTIYLIAFAVMIW